MSRVARFHADRTNQKLYFARLSCQQAEQTEHVQQAQAHREAAGVSFKWCRAGFFAGIGTLLSSK